MPVRGSLADVGVGDAAARPGLVDDRDGGAHQLVDHQAHGALVGMRAQVDHRALEPRVTHGRHSNQQLALEIAAPGFVAHRHRPVPPGPGDRLAPPGAAARPGGEPRRRRVAARLRPGARRRVGLRPGDVGPDHGVRRRGTAPRLGAWRGARRRPSQGAREQQGAADDAQRAGEAPEQDGARDVRQPHTENEPQKLEYGDQHCRIPVNEAMPDIFQRPGGRGDDLQHLARRHGAERRVAEDHHQRDGEHRPAGPREARAEARCGADRTEEPLLAARAAVAAIRADGGPFFIEARTYRFRAHSMFDPELYRPKDEVETWKQHGPIISLTARLKAWGLMTEDDYQGLQREVEKEVEEAIAFAEAGTWEPVEDLGRFVYSEPTNR